MLEGWADSTRTKPLRNQMVCEQSDYMELLHDNITTNSSSTTATTDYLQRLYAVDRATQTTGSQAAV